MFLCNVKYNELKFRLHKLYFFLNYVPVWYMHISIFPIPDTSSQEWIRISVIPVPSVIVRNNGAWLGINKDPWNCCHRRPLCALEGAPANDILRPVVPVEQRSHMQAEWHFWLCVSKGCSAWQEHAAAPKQPPRQQEQLLFIGAWSQKKKKEKQRKTETVGDRSCRHHRYKLFSCLYGVLLQNT